MKDIEEIEKHLETNRKTLLFSLRKNNWTVSGVEEICSRWDLDEKWFIQSARENKGFSIELLFCKHDGLHDGINKVLALQPSEPIPEPYRGETFLHLDGRRFENRLEDFLNVLHQFRIGSSEEGINEKI